MKKLYSIGILSFLIINGLNAQNALEATFKGRYSSGYYNNAGGVMEISTYDPSSKRLFTVNGNTGDIDIINLADPANPVLISSIDINVYGGGANSVSIKNGVLAAAVEATVKQNEGSVVFFTASTGSHLKTVMVGSLPDMLTFTPDGSKVVTANEGEPSDDYLTDPEGTISIIDLSNGVANATETRLNFNAYDGIESLLRADGIRIFGPGASTSEDLEPEYVTISSDSKTAWVVCQENNAMVIVNLINNTILDIKPLGYKNHNSIGNGLDASDRNPTNPSTVINIANWPVRGLYMPDGIATIRHNNKTYIITANEGDSREYLGFNEELRIGSGSFPLDLVSFPNATNLKLSNNLGRLKTTSTLGDVDSDGDFDAIYTFGARSFSIWDSSMVRIYDSGDDIEQYIAANNSVYFNANHNTDNIMSSRSDDKGPEPESVITAVIGDSTYAFVALERISAVMVYNVTNPFEPTFVQYLSTRDFSQLPVSTAGAGVGTGGDLGPEGLLYIAKENSPNGVALLLVSYEVSGTVVIYELAAPAVTTITEKSEYDLSPLQLFPNPVNGGIINLTKPSDIIVYNAYGIEMYNMENSKIIDVTKFEKGIYFVKSKNGEVVKFLRE